VATPRQFMRPVWIALMATLGVMLIGDGRSATAGTITGRMAQMRRAGCCCRMLPAGGCYCEPATSVCPAGDSARPSQTIGQFSAFRLRIESTRPCGTCQCQSRSPSTPFTEPDRPTTELRPDLIDDPFMAGSSCDASSLSTVHTNGHTGWFGACPLYLGLSRLLI
jgi:hypothetical protein